MNSIIEHVKQVAKDDVRTFFAPFVGAFNAVKQETQRRTASDVSFPQSQAKHKS